MFQHSPNVSNLNPGIVSCLDEKAASEEENGPGRLEDMLLKQSREAANVQGALWALKDGEL